MANGAQRNFLFSEGGVFNVSMPEHSLTMTFTQLACVALSTALYFVAFRLNAYAFHAFELHAGANWIFLPAGFRLLCTLVFGGEGAIGLLIASALIVTTDFSMMDPLTAFVAPLLSAGAPYLIYRLALRAGMPATLAQLTPAKLAQLGLAYALASAGLHSVWFALRGIHSDLISGFTVMFVGDLLGTLIVLYSMKMVLAVLRTLRYSRSS